MLQQKPQLLSNHPKNQFLEAPRTTPSAEPDIAVQAQSTPADASRITRAEEDWLQRTVEPVTESKKATKSKQGSVEKNQDSFIRRKRIQGLLELMISARGIRFNQSNTTFTFSSNNFTQDTSSKNINILEFLRDLQMYQKKVPSEYFIVLNLLFPPTKAISLKQAKDLVMNRNCLNYITNQNVHRQRLQ